MSDQQPTYLDEQGNPIGPTYLDDNGNPISNNPPKQEDGILSKIKNSIFNVKPYEPLEGRSFQTAGSLLPKLEHPKNEGWPSYLMRGAYNQFIEPLGSAAGLLGGIKGLNPFEAGAGLEGRLAAIGKQIVDPLTSQIPKASLELGPSPVRGLLGPASSEVNPRALPPSEIWPTLQRDIIAGPTGTGGGRTLPVGNRMPPPDVQAEAAGMLEGNRPNFLAKSYKPNLPTENLPYELPTASPKVEQSTYPKLNGPVQDITPTKAPNVQAKLTQMAADGEINHNDLNLYEQLGVKPSAKSLITENNPGKSSDDLLTKLANLSSKTTRSVLGFHIPGTALSFHGVNEAIRNTLFGGEFGPLAATGRLADATTYLFRPGKANDYLQANLAGLGRAIEDGGLKVATTDIGLKPLFEGKNIITKGFNYLTDPKPLFGQVIPALKLKSYEGLLSNFQKSGMEYKQAAQLAGEATNNIFGGLNLSQLERNPNTQKLFRAVALAPDWLETNVRLGKGMFQALKDPTNPAHKQYLVGATNFLGAYTTANVLNAINNDGKFMFQNDVGHEMDIAVGKDSAGRIRYIRPFGTAMDMFRIPMTIAHAAVTNGNIGETFNLMRSRTSEPLQFATDLLTNTDWKGSPLYGRTKFGKPLSYGQQGLNLGTDMMSHFAPTGLEKITNYLKGQISPEQTITEGLQLPVGYKFPPK